MFDQYTSLRAPSRRAISTLVCLSAFSGSYTSAASLPGCSQDCTAYVPAPHYVSWSLLPTSAPSPSYIKVAPGEPAEITVTETYTLVYDMAADTTAVVSNIFCGKPTDGPGARQSTATTNVEIQPGVTSAIAFPTQVAFMPYPNYSWEGVLPTGNSNASTCSAQSSGLATVPLPTRAPFSLDSYPAFPSDQADFLGSCYVAVVGTASVGQAWYASEYPDQAALQTECQLLTTPAPALNPRQAPTARPTFGNFNSTQSTAIPSSTSATETASTPSTSETTTTETTTSAVPESTTTTAVVTVSSASSESSTLSTTTAPQVPVTVASVASGESAQTLSPALVVSRTITQTINSPSSTTSTATATVTVSPEMQTLPSSSSSSSAPELSGLSSVFSDTTSSTTPSLTASTSVSTTQASATTASLTTAVIAESDVLGTTSTSTTVATVASASTAVSTATSTSTLTPSASSPSSAQSPSATADAVQQSPSTSTSSVMTTATATFTSATTILTTATATATATAPATPIGSATATATAVAGSETTSIGNGTSTMNGTTTSVVPYTGSASSMGVSVALLAAQCGLMAFFM